MELGMDIWLRIKKSGDFGNSYTQFKETLYRENNPVKLMRIAGIGPIHAYQLFKESGCYWSMKRLEQIYNKMKFRTALKSLKAELIEIEHELTPELLKMLREKKFDEQQCRDFYRFLRHEHETEIRLINPNQKGMVQNLFVQSEDEFVKVCRQYSGSEYNIYAGINERKPKGTKSQDVVFLRTLIMDIDSVRPNKDDPATDTELKNCEKQVDYIIRAKFPYGTVKKAESANGFYLIWALPEIKITNENREEISGKLKSFFRYMKRNFESEHAKIDIISDLSRVIKVLGTESVKGTPTETRPHRLAYCFDTLTREPDYGIWKYISGFESEQLFETASIPVEEITDVNKIKLLKERIEKLMEKDTKLKLLLEGNLLNFPSRSEADNSAVSKLIYYRFSKDEIFYLMDNLSNCSKWKNSNQQYKEHTYGKAYAYIKKKVTDDVSFFIEESQTTKKDLDKAMKRAQQLGLIS